MSQQTPIDEDSWWSSTTVNENLIRQLSLKEGGLLGTKQQDNDIPISGSGKISYKSFNKNSKR